MSNEADTCRKYVVPKLAQAGWEDPPHSIAEQRAFTDGRIVVTGNKVRRRKQKRADYLLRYNRDLTLAVVEAKASYKSAGDGMQQAKEYSEMLGLKFAYSTNGGGSSSSTIRLASKTSLMRFTPDQLWSRLRSHEGIGDGKVEERFFDPLGPQLWKDAPVLSGDRHQSSCSVDIEGKDANIAHDGDGGRERPSSLIKSAGSSGTQAGIGPGISTGRRSSISQIGNVLIDDPKDKTFGKFGDARWKIEKGEAKKSRDIYFSTYQSIAKRRAKARPLQRVSQDFFDLTMKVDERHRGSARDDSNWREILEYFEPAYQLGMTATPLRKDNRDTHRYFGKPVYEAEPLRQGIEDGFLAPYRVHRVVTEYDAEGWRPTRGRSTVTAVRSPTGFTAPRTSRGSSP